MKAVLLLLVVLVCVVASAAANIEFSGNISASIEKDGDWAYRKTDISSWDIGVSAGLFYSSVSLSGTKHSAMGDAVWGAGYVGLGAFPKCWLAYWDSTVTFNPTTNFLDVDTSSSKGFVAHSYYALVEKNPAGEEVARANLKQKPLVFDYDTSAKSTNGALKWITWSAAAPQWAFELTFVTSDIVGKIKGGGVISPKSVETIVKISSWPYKSNQNTLSLVLGVATGSASFDGNLLVSGSAASKVYFNLAKTAIIDGSDKDVKVSAYQTGDFDTYFDNDINIEAQLKAKYDGDVKVYCTEVTFPAGAASITYDPSIGAGEVPPDAKSAASIVAFCNIGLLLFVLLLNF